MQKLGAFTTFLQEFETHLDTGHPEKSKIPAKIVGYGEISAVLSFPGDAHNRFVYKRMPLFETLSEAQDYQKLYEEYNAILARQAGLKLPGTETVVVTGKKAKPVLYLSQEKLSPESIGNKAIHRLSDEQSLLLVRLALRELKKVFAFNKASPGLRVGVDGQISNWAVADFDASRPSINEQTKLFFLDTSTPLIQKNGKEQLNPELFLRSAPSFLVWLIRLLFLQEVMTRYYDFRRVAVDIIANFYKEQKSRTIPALIVEVNRFFSEEAPDFHIKEITEKEVASYYKQDALIWRVFLSLRKLDRFLRTKIFRKDYPYILSGKIKR